jgi:hypothetical protein
MLTGSHLLTFGLLFIALYTQKRRLRMVAPAFLLCLSGKKRPSVGITVDVVSLLVHGIFVGAWREPPRLAGILIFY